MKITITGARAEGKTRLLETIQTRVLNEYGSRVHVVDGGHYNEDGVLVGQHEVIEGDGALIEVFVTNDVKEAIRFLKTPEDEGVLE